MTLLAIGRQVRRSPRILSLVSLAELLVRHLKLCRTIRHVEDLDPHLLRDIGLENHADIRRALREGRTF